jgi:outer membrane receptor for ferrienterochelin and colicin
MHVQNEIQSSIVTARIRRLTAGAALVAVAFGLFLANPAFAQGVTATLTGRVFNEALDLPGVSVTAKSPRLQGTRTTVTGTSGDYVFANMPPGEYQITFALSGFQTQTLPITLGASQQSRLDANLLVTGVTTTTTVTAQSDSISQSSTQATTYSGDLLGKLPTARTITSAVLLAPGVNQNGPNGVSISGAQSTENLYTVNGVVITDNVRSTPNTLFIEDAIQETTTTTSGVEAQYGRFTGGVINTITKSGGNTFSGSLRSTFTNDAWQSTSGYRTATGVNPQEGIFVNKAIPTFEATLGGPIMKDKVWFFGSGRYFDTSDAVSSLTRFTNVAYTSGAKELRYEGKLTLTPFQSQTLTASYMAVKHDDVNYSFTSIPVSDLASIYNRQLPQEQLALNYNGVVTNSFFVEAQYSRRKFTFENSGGIYMDPVQGTVIRDLSRGVSYNAPIFCGICGPEKRDNNDYTIKGTYFLSTPSLGSHNIVGGYDNYGGQRLSNNYQSGSNFVLYTFGASVVQGSNIYPVIPAGTELDWWPVLQQSQGSDLRTQSAYLNDSWRLSNRLSFNIGVRYDKNDATDAAGNVTSKDSTFSPRLAAIFDVTGTGKLRVTASYAKYVAALQETQAGSGATLAGTPADFYWYYDGPGINTNPNGPFLSPQAALTQVFNWFTAAGCLPNPLATTCTIPQGGAPSIGGVNVQIQNSLASPSVKEYALGFAGNFGTTSRGSFRADIVRREYTDYYDLKKDLTTGTVTSPFGARQDLGLVVNSSDYRREYTGLHTQFQYRLGERLDIGGVWTWSHLIGNLVGETSGSGPVRGGDHVYPEYFSRSWENPVGDLSQDMRHHVRVWGTYDLPVPARFGSLSFSAIQSWDTGLPYAAVGTIKTGAYVTNPGYLTPPASEPYYFTSRNAYRTEDIYRTDLQMNFSYRIAGGLEIFLVPQVFNVFNAQHISSVNATVNTNFNSTSLAAFNPFTNSSPVECPQGTALATCKTMGANYQKGSLFGTPTSQASYQTPRYFQFSVGLRF